MACGKRQLINATCIPGLSYVGSLSLRAASEQSALFVCFFFLGGGSFSDKKGAILGGSFNHRLACSRLSDSWDGTKIRKGTRK